MPAMFARRTLVLLLSLSLVAACSRPSPGGAPAGSAELTGADAPPLRISMIPTTDPGKLLRFRGALGPLQAMAVDGSMTWELTMAGDKTHLQLTYTVGGYLPGGLGERMAKPVDGVLTLQVQRLKKLMETGQP